MNLKDHWQQIVKLSPDGITITDMEGKVFFVSDKIIQIFGASSDKEILGTNLIDWIHPDDREKAVFYIKNAVKGIPTSGAAEYRMLRVDKTYLYLESKGRVLKDDNDNTLGMIYSSRDITERKKLEITQLQQLKHESMEALTGGIAHDFNNILTVVKGQISLIKMDLSINDDSKLSLIEVESAIDQAKRITDQLSSLAQGGLPVKSTFSISKMVEKIAILVIQEPKIKCSFMYDNACFEVYADKGQINRVLSNLIINAAEAMPEGGDINIDIEIINGFKHKFLNEKIKYLLLSVTDTGSGISNEILPRIFDPYFSTKSRGTGMGLFSSFAIMQNHEGHLIAAANLDKGSVFSLYLPV